MVEAVTITKRDSQTANRRNRFWKLFLQQKYLYMMSLAICSLGVCFQLFALMGLDDGVSELQAGKSISLIKNG